MGNVPSTTDEALALPNSKDQLCSDSLASTVPCHSSPSIDMFSNARRFSVNGGTFNIALGTMMTRELLRVPPSVFGDCSERNEQSHEGHHSMTESSSQSQLLDRDDIPPSETVAFHTDCQPHNSSFSITRPDLVSQTATSGRLRDQPPDHLTSIHQSPPLEHVDERCEALQSLLNRQHTRTPSQSPEPPESSPPPIAAPLNVGSPLFSQAPSESSTNPAAHPPTETDSERYGRLLLPKRHGYPLWVPAPYTGPPPAHIADGVRIGDVGVLNNDGGFDFLFNVCHSADDPLNCNGVPAGFKPFSLDPQETDIYEQLDYFTSNSHETSSEIECAEHIVHNSSTNVQSKMTFTTTKSEGAILVLPAGANRIDARRIRDLRQYVMRNAISWYSYINDQRGWEVPNNALYLVTGCDKCTNWAVASFRKQTMERSVSSLELLVTSESESRSGNINRDERNPFHSSFRDIARNNPRLNMWSSWRGCSTAACRTGPRQTQTGGDDITHTRQPNQCVFLRGFKIAIDMDKINRSPDESVELTSAVDPSLDNILSKGTDIPFGFGQSGRSSSDTGSDTGSHSGSSSNSSTDSGEGYTSNHGDLDDASGTTFSIQFIPKRQQPYHPSDIINRFLLSQNEKVKVAVTHDDEWCTALDPLAADIPGDDQLLENIFSKYSATITPEGTFLEPKSTSLNVRDSAGIPLDGLAVLSEVTLSTLTDASKTSLIVPPPSSSLPAASIGPVASGHRGPRNDDASVSDSASQGASNGFVIKDEIKDETHLKKVFSRRIDSIADAVDNTNVEREMAYSRHYYPESVAESVASSSSSSHWPPPRLSNDFPSHSNDTVDDAGVEEVFQSVVKGRKSWKTLKGGKMVWPPELEAALLEGLARYQPDDSRETRLLGRFPMRNRFISEYIYQKTGEYRSAKQVGSRLQQLRDTCDEDKEFQRLLSPCRPPGAPISNRSHYSSLLRYGFSPSMLDSSSDTPLPNSPVSRSASLQGTASPVTYIIHIVPERSTTYPSSSDEHSQPSTSTSDATIIGTSQDPRPIRSIDPTLAFGPTVDASLMAQSYFTVYKDDSKIHQERTALKIADSSTDLHGAYVYTTSLVPSFWSRICDSSDPTKYTIYQEIYKEESQCDPSLIFSATYKFRYPSTAASPSLHSFPAASAITSVSGIESVQQSAGVSQGYGIDYPVSVDHNSGDELSAMMSFDDKAEASHFNFSRPEGWTSFPAGSPVSDHYGTYGDDSGGSNTLSQTTSHFSLHSNYPPYTTM